MKNKNPLFCLFTILALAHTLYAQGLKSNMSFVVTMDSPSTHIYHVTLTCLNLKKDEPEFKMCAWTPGYYQIIDFAKALQNFHARGNKGKELPFTKIGSNKWRVNARGEKQLTIQYDIKAVVSFVGNVYLDDQRGYITPGGLFLYQDEELKNPVTIAIKPFSAWNSLVATSLDPIAGQKNIFLANDFDVLFDSPFLMGRLESFPPFTVWGRPHYFIGFEPGNFDRNGFMTDLKKIVETSVSIIGDIPYTHYTFLMIGAGGGGIEHLNSASLSFRKGQTLDNSEEKLRLYHFLAHEYFHHYNVKRIRPIELGPFDYSKENRTNMLWVSEGLSVYYEYLITQRAGLSDDEQLLASFRNNLRIFENKPGHLYQSATQASYETWSDGPNGRVSDEENKTISYYEKGPLLGLMLDFKIRHETKNKQSLDDLMRLLYNKYYLKKKRGFTEKEFQDDCETIAGTDLSEVFSYASTVKPVDYPKYFSYAGLDIDTLMHDIPGPWLGLSAGKRDSIIVVTESEWNSPAWLAGIRRKDTVLLINGNKTSSHTLSDVIETKKHGDTLNLVVGSKNGRKNITITLKTKREKTFTIKQIDHPDSLQAAIYSSWTKKTQFADKL